MNDERGFTLLELLIALSLFAVVIAAAYAAFVSGLNAVPRGEALAERSARLRAATSIMEKQVRSLVNYTVIGEDDEPQPYFQGRSDGFSFVTAAPQLNGGEGLSCVVYWIEGNAIRVGETPIVSPQSLVKENCVDHPTASAVLLDGLTSARFQYVRLEGNEVERPDRWSSIDDGLPAAVEVTLEGLSLGRSSWSKQIPVMAVAYGLGAYDPEGEPPGQGPLGPGSGDGDRDDKDAGGGDGE